MADTYLTRTPSSSGNRKTWTLSMWVKRSSDNYSQLSGTGTGSTYLIIGFGDTQPRILQSANAGESVEVQINKKCRDLNGYYHLVFRVDTTQATASNRIRIYINGEEGTYSETDYPSQNLDMYYNYNILHGFGARSDGDSGFDGIISHVHFADGQSLAPTVFGETDSTTGEWKIITSPSFTLGTNGFSILKDGNTITDQSSNSNNWTLANGTLTKTEDNPSNVFATLNPLIPTNAFSSNFTNGNTTITGKSDGKGVMLSTLGASTGKYYFEAKVGNSDGTSIGVSNDEISLDTWSPSTGNYVLYSNNGNVYRSSSTTASGTTYTTNDIIGVAWNATSSEVTFYKNGSAIASAYGVEGTQGTMFIAMADTSTSGTPTVNFNFGNGYFGTTAVSSAGTNASGIGIFEFDVPAGYTALSTKGLNL